MIMLNDKAKTDDKLLDDDNDANNENNYSCLLTNIPYLSQTSPFVAPMDTYD